MNSADSHRPRGSAAILALTIGLLAAGCSSDTKSDGSTTPSTVLLATQTDPARSSSSVTSTTSASTSGTTTDSTGDTSNSGVPSTVDTAPRVPVYPLTGLPILDPAAAKRPALVVKIDNHPEARPQSGLNEADLVYEENVENLTRFAAVFQSNGADPVGPIRSGRTQDVDLLGSLNKPIFAWSGGNARVSAAINASDLVPVNETRAGKAMFRSNGQGRSAPHNLYGDVSALYTFAPPDAGPPPQQFQYRDVGTQVAGTRADAVKVSMDNAQVLWKWDVGSGTYLRSTDGKPHMDALTGLQVATSNVILLYVDYRPSPADGRSPEAQTEGYGVAWVFSGGKYIEGSWTRTDRLQTFTLLDAEGKPILLTPGHTFVELARAGKGAVAASVTDIGSVQYP